MVLTSTNVLIFIDIDIVGLYNANISKDQSNLITETGDDIDIFIMCL